MNDPRKIGFIGLGMMGYPMASRLVQAGYAVTVADVAAAQTARFVAEHSGASVADSRAALAQASVVITMLPNSAIVDSVVLGTDGQGALLDLLPAGATLIDMSSSQPLRSRLLAEKLAARGLHFLDAPVSGGVKRALDGSLAIIVGGDEADFRQQQPLLAQMGKSITYMGAAGSGHAMKALNNYVSAAGLVASVEALLVGQSFGLDPAVMTDVLNHSTGKNNTTENKVKQFMLSAAFNSGFSLQLMAKDLGIAMQLGESLGWEMQLGQTVLHLWQTAAGQLAKNADHTEMYRYLQAVEKIGSEKTGSKVEESNDHD